MRRACAVVVAMAMGSACWSGVRAQEVRDLVGRVAPQIARPDLSGKGIDLEQYRGKVVLLNFWATWCAPCRVELPEFSTWQTKYGDEGLQVLAVSMDDTQAPVQKAVRRMHLGFPVVMGDAQMGEAYGGVLGLPVTFLIDRNGVIVEKFKGAVKTPALESKVKHLLQEK